MSSLETQTSNKLNRLQRTLPEGMVVDAAWLEQQGYSRSLRAKYVKNSWLDLLAGGVYRRAPAKLAATHQQNGLHWQQVVISLQTLLDCPFTLGGRTALELHGFGHYLVATGIREVHLHGSKPQPRWIAKLNLEERFQFHNAKRLFQEEFTPSTLTVQKGTLPLGLTSQPWGSWDWPLVLSTPERAVLELLDEVPGRETFHQADMLMEGLRNLSPRRLQALLVGCHSVKVKRLFLWFAERHQHAWRKRFTLEAIDLGHGKRMLVRGGKFDSRFNITVPEDLDGLR